MPDGSAIATATSAAAIAVRHGDLAAAGATLSAVLGAASGRATVGGPPDTAGSFDADVALDVAEAATLYARVLAATGCATDGVGYAASADRAACQTARPGSDLRLRAAATHAYLLRTTGDPAAAVPVGRGLARQLIARFGATDRRTLAAHGDLAAPLHAAGECLTGRQILHRTGELVRSTYGPDDPLATRMRDRLADLTRRCCPPAAVGAERSDTVADHTCGQPDAAASISIADLFGDLFAGDGHEVGAQPPDDAAEPTEVPPAVARRPALPPAGLLATLGVAIPTARPRAPAALLLPPTDMPKPAALLLPPTDMPKPAALLLPPTDMPKPAAGVLAPADVGGEASIDSVEGSVDPHVVVERAETAEMAAPAGREDSRTPDVCEAATTADDAEDPSRAADVGGFEAPASGMPPWADRPTAGYPTVPITVGLHPTWVAASPDPVSAPRPVGVTSTVGVAGTSVAGLPVITHSRATFGRIRRLSTQVGATDRPQRIATVGSAKTIEGE